MRINKYVALATGMSRRAADTAIADKRVTVNGAKASKGQEVTDADKVALGGRPIATTANSVTIMLNKPVGYVVSRDGQGSKTIYDLLPTDLRNLKPVGRLDKDSSGLLLLTNDGNLAHELSHPSFQKEKVYEVGLDKPLTAKDKQKIENGVELEDGVSLLSLEARVQSSEKPKLQSLDSKLWFVRMHEGRNRQIRRTFSALGYTVTKLHRTQFGKYGLQSVKDGKYLLI
jgi:23S rRNA pseudouridine2605 synthase